MPSITTLYYIYTSFNVLIRSFPSITLTLVISSRQIRKTLIKPGIKFHSYSFILIQPTPILAVRLTNSFQCSIALTIIFYFQAGPSYVSPQNQTPPSRPQYPTFPYRTQHGSRPSSHPRYQYLNSKDI